MCYHPVTIKTPQGYQQVPCGHCLECLRKYQNDWTNRFDAELKACEGHAVFFTLTYDDYNVPKNYLYEGEIYRSSSSYGFTNVDPLTDKLRTPYRGQHKKYAERPYKPLQDAGVDCTRILDFNVQRKDSKQFVEHLKRLYHDYLRLYDAIESSDDDWSWNRGSTSCDFDFDADCDLNKEEDLLSYLFGSVEQDDEYYVTSSEESTLPDSYTERPIMMFNSVRAQDVQDWIKRGRIMLERKCKKDGKPVKKFKFFVTAEYGPRTLRPHYHGIIFGVTADEVDFMRLDWQRRFGRRIQWENVDMSKGAGSYVAKYCSKGFFEHPLCARNFFYFKGRRMDDGASGVKEIDRKLYGNKWFTEYHSKHYERCMEIFGVDKPIVDPVFHLVSQGLGIDYVERNKERFTARAAALDALDYDSGDVEPVIEVRRLKAVAYYEDRGYVDCYIPMKGRENYGERTNVSELQECLEELARNFKYTRVTRKDGVEKTFSYAMPKYYRKKILGDGLRAALATYVQSEFVRVYQEKYNQVRTDHPAWSDYEISDYLDTEEKEALYARMMKQVDSVTKFYNKSKL